MRAQEAATNKPPWPVMVHAFSHLEKYITRESLGVAVLHSLLLFCVHRSMVSLSQRHGTRAATRDAATALTTKHTTVRLIHCGDERGGARAPPECGDRPPSAYCTGGTTCTASTELRAPHTQKNRSLYATIKPEYQSVTCRKPYQIRCRQQVSQS